MSGRRFISRAAAFVLSAHGLFIVTFMCLGFFGLPLLTVRLMVLIVVAIHGFAGRPDPDGTVGVAFVEVVGVIVGLALLVIYFALLRRFLRLCERVAQRTGPEGSAGLDGGGV
jgi:hypothetical protein